MNNSQILIIISSSITITTAASKHWIKKMQDKGNTSSLILEVLVWAWDLDQKAKVLGA